MAHFFPGQPVEEEFMWSITLDSTKKEWEWLPADPTDEAQDDDDDDEEEDPSYKPNHRLLVKNAILDSEAKENEAVVLELETTGYKNEKVVAPFVAMRGGKDLQRYIDLLIPAKGKIKLVKGEGPITLVGSHCVEYLNSSPYDDESDEDEEEEGAESSEDDEMDMEQEQEAAAVTKEDKAGDKKKKKAAKVEEKPEEKEAEPETKKTPKKTPKKESPKKESPKKEEGKKTPKKAESAEAEEKKTPGKEAKKRKASGDADEGKKKRKSSGGN